MGEHEGTHVVFQQDNGELAEEVFEGTLEGSEVPDSLDERAVLSAHDVDDASQPPDPQGPPSTVAAADQSDRGSED
jgi:hypothetical protein